MSSRRLPSLKARDVIKVLTSLGFRQIRQSGSHVFFLHTDGRATIVPSHGSRDIGKGLLRKIMRDIEVSPQNFMDEL